MRWPTAIDQGRARDRAFLPDLHRRVGAAPLLGLAALLAAPAAAFGQCPALRVTEAESNDLDRFGSAIAATGDVLAVTEQGTDRMGLVHLFVPAGADWAELQELVPSHRNLEQGFGGALDLGGAHLVVGAENDDLDGEHAGAAYVFALVDAGEPGPTDDVWGEIARLRPAGAPSRFGHAVDVSGRTAAIAALGAVYLYERDDRGTRDPADDSWRELATIGPPPGGGDRFGDGIALSADAELLLVCDPGDLSGAGVGAVTPFERDDGGTPDDPFDDVWTPAAKILPADATEWFRGELALRGDTLFCAGSFVVQEHGYEESRMFVYERDETDAWSPTDELTAGEWFQYGDAMALGDDVAFVWRGIPGFPPHLGGHVLRYERAGSKWTHTDTLWAPDTQVLDGFGRAVCLSGDTLFVGAPGREYVDDVPPSEGAVHLFELGRDDPWSGTPGPSLSELPALAAWGCLEADTPARLRLYNGFQTATALLIVGGEEVLYPGGVLGPSPDFVLTGLVTDEYTSLELVTRWPRPAVIPPGTTLYFQCWVDLGFGDPVPTNLLQAVTP